MSSDGSSSCRRRSDACTFSSSPLLPASIANETTGAGSAIGSTGGRLVDVGQHVAGVGLLELRDRADHAGAEHIGRLVVLALQHQQLADPLLAVRAAVDQLRVALSVPANTRSRLMLPL